MRVLVEAESGVGCGDGGCVCIRGSDSWRADTGRRVARGHARSAESEGGRRKSCIAEIVEVRCRERLSVCWPWQEGVARWVDGHSDQSEVLRVSAIVGIVAPTYRGNRV